MDDPHSMQATLFSVSSLAENQAGTVRLVSKRKGGIAADPSEVIIDVDRTNPVLGNRHILHDYRDDNERALVIAAYEADYRADFAAKGPMYRATESIARLIAEGKSVALRCWCAPRPCHARIVAEHAAAMAKNILAAPAPGAPVALEIREHEKSGYRDRTIDNARSAALTAAFAVDFETAGERLTRRGAGESYLACPLSDDPTNAARAIYRRLRNGGTAAPTINIAGNGMHTLHKHGWTQERANGYVFEALAKVHEHWPIGRIISGGQTGIDTAGIVAARAIGIPATALLPRGFVQRDRDGADAPMDPAEIRRRIIEWSTALAVSIA